MRIKTETPFRPPGCGADARPLAWLETLEGERFPIQSCCSLGRSASNQIALAGEKVSRHHAVIQRQGENDFWLTDLGSCNGTWLNGRRVSQATRLYDPDQIAIGPYVLTFRQPNGKTRSRPEYTVTEATIQEIKSVNCWLLVGRRESDPSCARTRLAGFTPRATDSWLDECKDILEQHGGAIQKYLSDGLFACWRDQASVPAAVACALVELKKRQALWGPSVRFLLHHGAVIVRGLPNFREESFSGSAVNFVFRMEKLANALPTPILVSEAAQKLFDGDIALNETGHHNLAGFEEDFLFYQF